MGAVLCFWSVAKSCSPAIILLGVICLLAVVQNGLFILSAFQEGKPFLPFLPLEVRKQAYLYGRLLGPPQAVLFPVFVLVIVIENARRQET